MEDELVKAKAKLSKELEALEIRRDIMGNVVSDLRQQYDAIVETVINTRLKIDGYNRQLTRIRQSKTEKERASRVAEAAAKRQQTNQGYRLGSKDDDDGVRPPIPQITERLI